MPDAMHSRVRAGRRDAVRDAVTDTDVGHPGTDGLDHAGALGTEA